MWQLVETTTGKPYHLPAGDGRIAIHGHQKSGAEFFTIVAAADAIRRGENVVCIAAQGHVIRQLQAELGLHQPVVRSPRVTDAIASSLEDMQLITFMKRTPNNIVESMRGLRDLVTRVVFVFDVELVLTPELWSILATHRRVVLAGDWSALRLNLNPTLFSPRVMFSSPPKQWPDQRPALPSYIGFLLHESKNLQLITQQVAK